MIQLMSDYRIINKEFEVMMEEDEDFEESYNADYKGLDISLDMPNYISDDEDENEALEDSLLEDDMDLSNDELQDKDNEMEHIEEEGGDLDNDRNSTENIS